MNVQMLIGRYRTLKFVNNKLKYKMSKAKVSNNIDYYLKYKDLQKQVESCLLELKKCSLEDVEKLNNLLKQAMIYYFEFKSLFNKTNIERM